MVLLYKSCYCSVCEKEFKDANALSDHKRQVHTEENETCKICGKLETNSYTLYGHMQNHETKICQVCNENLPKKNFARHMEKHNEVVYSCEICNLNFTRKDALKDIRVIITNLKMILLLLQPKNPEDCDCDCDFNNVMHIC